MKLIIATNGQSGLRDSLASECSDSFEVIEDSIFSFIDPRSVIVSPGNSYYCMDGGLDQEMIERFPVLKRELSSLTYLPVGQSTFFPDIESIFGRRGNVMYSPTMDVPRNIRNSINIFNATRSAILAIQAYEKRTGETGKFKYLVFPAMGHGVGGAPAKMVARQMYAASDESWPLKCDHWIDACKSTLWLMCREGEIPERERLGDWVI